MPRWPPLMNVVEISNTLEPTWNGIIVISTQNHALCPYCSQNDSIIHTFCNCHWTKWFFSEVIKWFNVENATSFAPSSSELIFGLNNERKNQSSSAIVKKLDFTLLFAKYYLYINKLAPKDLSLDEFKAKISWRYDFEKPPPSIS